MFTKFGPDHQFMVLTACPLGNRFYHPDFYESDRCKDCEELLLEKIGETNQPRLRAPFRSLTEQLTVITWGLELELEVWRDRLKPPQGEYHSPFDGKVFKDLEGSNKEPFFVDRGQKTAQSTSLGSPST
ncbi:hypothetical protein BOTBODRAFT_182009 [Botryobasidium botryosum FD-172 SS1]|uniref:Uncharacterized protein n=1 Tax=Botryobasidium botryosum (strain FD-172 SS1) TaxID=930990 RepID=A0A067M340_BOTB1|nr:hypothetical protein BOTBODRAFT_182009 [Botryobasidium botryosum FD-172 SS1]